MAMIDVVKCNSPFICWKYPKTDLKLGTQLVVHPSKVAFFVKGGKIYDKFEEGTHTLTTNNIPLLNGLINLPFGGTSPFQAEVWFIDLKLQQPPNRWDTETPITIRDPVYGNLPIKLDAYGTYALQVIDPEAFLRRLVGNNASASMDDMNETFTGEIMSHLTDTLATKIKQDNISVIDIPGSYRELNKYCNECLCNVLMEYGLEVKHFAIISTSPVEDKNYQELNEGIARAAKMNAAAGGMSDAAKAMYQMDRSFDVMDSAASNEGSAGQFVGMGAGLGAGLGVGGAMGSMFSQNLNMNSQAAAPAAPPPPPQAAQYYILINGAQQGPYPVPSIMQTLQNGQANAETLCWKQGMADWQPLKSQPDFAMAFSAPPPPPPQAAPPPPPAQG